jgi:putative ABC transport system ATP-binding protein
MMIPGTATNPATTHPSASPLVRLRGIERAYETRAGRTWVLRHIELDIRRGEFISVMGPSGAGKSTLLNILGMLDQGWEGEYQLDGNAVHAMKPKQRMELNRRYVGFVFQQFHLLDDLTVYENLEIPLSYRDVRRAEREAIVAEALDRFGIVAKKDLYPAQLSGGQQQLVAVARATVARPALILADEPTGSLHSSQGEMILQLLAELNRQGTTIVQVTHSEVNAAYGHRTIQLRDGWMVGE